MGGSEYLSFIQENSVKGRFSISNNVIQEDSAAGSVLISNIEETVSAEDFE